MAQYILPISIESRKVVFLQLQNNFNQHESFSLKPEDNFVIRLPQSPISRNELLMIRKSSVLQSLGYEMKDIKTELLKFSLTLSQDEDIIELNLSDQHSGDQELHLSQGLVVRIQELQNGQIKLIVINEVDFKEACNLKLKIILNLNNLSQKIQQYVGCCQFQMVPNSDIRFLALDFGSEASQMRDGTYVQDSLSVTNAAVDLFRLIRNNATLFEKYNDSDFEQYETDLLYKSIFYASINLSGLPTNYRVQGQEFYWLDGGLSMAVPSNMLNARNSPFLNTNVQIPNLKLVSNNTNLTNGIRFQLNNGVNKLQISFSNIRGSLYMGLLQQMLRSYFIQKLNKPVYLRLTLLVPNIYASEEIQETRRIIAEILNKFALESKNILGYEVDCLSESDASFLGCLQNVTLLPNNYYIIVDCGKGTTDYSILEIEQDNSNTFRPLYRNGFAGAGNYVTYAFVKSACYFLIHEMFEDVEKKEKVKRFLEDKFSSENLVFHKKFFNQAEKWKKAQASCPPASKEHVEKIWKDARSGQQSFEKFFDLWPNNADENTFLELLSMVNESWDWNGYVANSIENIVKDITEQMEPVIRHQNSHAHCGGIILTGRGSMFEPLANAITNALKGIPGMQKVQRMQINGQKLKEVCLDGVFSQSLRFYADLSSTPVEVDTQTFHQVRKKPTGFFSKIFGTGYGVGAAYDSDTNSIEVISGQNLANTRFLIGGKIYKVSSNVQSNPNSSYILLPTRGATYLVEKSSDGTVKEFSPLIQDTASAINNDRIQDSLYPGWYRSSIVNSL